MTQPRNDTPFVDQENIAELARQEKQAAMLTKGLGGIFPELGNQLPEGTTRILDLGCGPGEWVRAVAQAFPHVEVTGLDRSESVLAYARSVAQDQQREHASFVSGNVRYPPFPAACFDLVNVRTLAAFLKRDKWEGAMREWYRVTRPGGLLRVTELQDHIHWNQPACEQLTRWLHQVFRQQGYGFAGGVDADVALLHPTPMLEQLLAQTGWQEIHRYPFFLDLSYGTPYYWNAIQAARVGYRQLWPAFQTLLGLSQEEIEQTYQEMLIELKSPQLQLTCSFFTFNAIRPRQRESPEQE
jgi:ubiquinone/menaquinone biosynthesis C-methylase UbiE